MAAGEASKSMRACWHELTVYYLHRGSCCITGPGPPNSLFQSGESVEREVQPSLRMKKRAAAVAACWLEEFVYHLLLGRESAIAAIAKVSLYKTSGRGLVAEPDFLCADMPTWLLVLSFRSCYLRKTCFWKLFL